MKKNCFVFLLFCFFTLNSSQSRSQDHCYPLAPDEVGLIGAGVSYDDLTVWPTSGEVYLTTGVYEMYDFQNCNIVINGDDVVLRKCRVTWNGNNIGVIRTSRTGAPRAGLVIEDCELNGQGDVHGQIADAGIWPGRFTMIRTWIYNIGNDIAKITDGVTIHRCYLGPVFYNPGAHADILQSGPTLLGTEPDPKQIITYNTFHGYHYVTGEHINGGLLVDPFYDAFVIGNWFRGCGYHLHLHTDSSNNGISHKVRDNVFETDFKFFYAYPPVDPFVNYEWYNNRFSDGSLAPIPGSTILEGSGETVPDISYTTCNSNVPVTGTITRDYWTGIDGGLVTDLTGNASYPDNPSGSDELTSLEAVDWNDPSVNANWADDYGQKIYGFLHPQTSGDYTFWIAGDDRNELYLSSDDEPANKIRIAYVDGWTTSRQWSKYNSQKSVAVSLSAGQSYYIEVIHKENGGGDNVAVGWAKPGESPSAPSEVIPGSVLSPFSVVTTIPVDGVTVSPASLNIDEGQTSDLTETISPVDATNQAVTWTSSNTSIATVDANGVVSGLNVGQAIITVTTNDGGFTAQCTVSVNAITITGTITRDYWTGIPGMYVSNLTGNANYPDNPTGSDELTSLEAVDWSNPQVAANWSDNYGQRIYGFLHPNVTGDYTFWIASDDRSELYLSTDADPANKIKIAYVDGWTSSRLWGKYSSQKSPAISLIAGQKYFIEAIHKENTGGDNAAVGWAKPGESSSAPSEVIPGNALSPYSVPPTIPVDGVTVTPASLNLVEGETSDLTETIAPTDATDKTVTWSSSNTSIATVDNNGMVTAVSGGNATITVTTNDGGYTANCSVTVIVAPVNEGHLYIYGENGTIVENRLFTSIHISNSTNITVRNCSLVFDRDQGALFKISDGSSRITVENCDMDGIDNACWGMEISNSSDLFISNNDIHHLADDGISMHYCTNVTLQDNKIHHLIAKGTDGLIDGPCYNGHSDGIELNDVHYLYMYRNIIYDVSGTSCFMAGSHEGLYPTNLFLENNIFIGNGVGFVVYFGTVHHVRAYNNIIYNGIYGGLAFNGVNTDIDFKNNICQAININHYGGTWDPVEHRFDHNLISDENTWGGYIFNPNDILAADPLWVNYPAYNATSFPVEVTIDDFRLRSNSPAIDGGISSGAPATDIVGASRPLGAGFDIGVYESNGIEDTDPPTTPTGLIASNITGSSFDLQWNPSTDYTGVIYDVYESGILVTSLYETSLSQSGLFCDTN